MVTCCNLHQGPSQTQSEKRIRLSPTVPLDTPARSRCEGGCCAGGGPHSCPWGAGETPATTVHDK